MRVYHFSDIVLYLSTSRLRRMIMMINRKTSEERISVAPKFEKIESI